MAYLKHNPSTGQWEQRYDVTHCSGCGGPLTVPHAKPVHHQCPSHGAHFELVCKTCRASTWDTVCDRPDEHRPLSGHDHSDPWAGVQEGPTLDIGEG